MIQRLILAIVILTWACATRAQVNYVLNPGLEQHSYCPWQYDQIDAANYWSSIDTVSPINQGMCRPEYCHPCNTFGFQIPNGQNYYQFPRTGEAMALSRIFGGPGPIEDVDYLQGRLYKKLTAGTSYCVTFYVSLADGSQYAVNHIGAYLDNGIIDTTSRCNRAIPSITPQVYTNTVIRDTANWTKIEGTFVANGTEKFITLGNFFPIGQFTYDSLRYSASWGLCFYLFDDVSVIESNLPADAGIDRHITQGDSTFIGRTPEVGLECSWYVAGNTTVIGRGAGIWVRPTQTTTYVVEQTLCGVVRRDSVKVEVWRVGVPGVNGTAQQEYYLSPNPLTGTTLFLQQAVTDGQPIQATIVNAAGMVIQSTAIGFKDRKTALNIGVLAHGLYLLQLKDGRGNNYHLKFVVE